MAIAALCIRNPVTVEKSAEIRKAVQLMRNENVGSLVVMEGNGKKKAVGILTDRDVALYAFDGGIVPNSAVEEIMSKKVVTVPDDLGIAETIDKMESQGVRRVIVEDRDGNVCGVVSADDILQLIAREMYGIGKLMDKQARSAVSFSKAS